MQRGATTGRTALLGGAFGLFAAVILLAPAALSGAAPARGDLADFFWPMKAHTAARWSSGVPLWNPLSGCGEPWLAQLQTGVFYPGDLTFFLPGAWGPLAGIALHLVIAGAGAAAWLSSLGTSRAGALLGASVYAGGGAFLSLALVYNNFETAAWLPWLFLAARVAARGGSPLALPASFALALLGGEPAIAAAGAGISVLIALGTRGDEPGIAARVPGGLPRAARGLALGLLLGLGLAAVAVVPFVDLARSSGRLSGVTRAEAIARPVGPSDLVDLVLPPPEALTRRASAGRGGYLATLALSPLVFVLAAAAGAGLAARPRLLVALLLLVLLGFLLALGTRGGLVPLLWDVGVLRGVRFPARWLVLSVLALAGLAGAGLDGWLHGRFATWPGTAIGDDEDGARSGRAVRVLVPAALFAGAVVSLLVSGAASGRASGISAWLALAATAIGIVSLAAVRFGGRPGLAGVLLVLLVAVPLPFASADLFAPGPAGSSRTAPGDLAGLAALPGRVFPVVSDGVLLSAFARGAGAGWSESSAERSRAALAGYTNLPDGIASAASPSPIGNPRRTRFLGAALAGGNVETILGLADVRHVVSPFPASIPGAKLERSASGVLVYALQRSSGRVFFARAGREAADDAAFRELTRQDFDPEAVVLLGPPSGALPAPRSSRTFSVARVVEDLPERFAVVTESSEAGFLVLTRSWDAGWEARLDGEPTTIRRAYLALSAVLLPAGAHRLELTYRPLSFRAGAAASVASLVIVLGIALAGRRPA